MARKRLLQSSDSEKQTWLINNGRIFAFLLLFVLVGGVSKLYFSSAAGITVKGRVYDSRTNLGRGGVVIYGCISHGTTHRATTNSTGYWSFNITVGYSYCARVVSGVPSSWSGPVTNNRPAHSTLKTYEYQIAGIDCIHVNSPYCDANAKSYDRAVDTGVDFKYTSPTPPAISSFTASPSTITSGQSSTLKWSSNTSSCTLKYGSTSKSVGGDSSGYSVKPSSSTTYTLTCSNTGGSTARSLTITVNKALPRPTISSFTANPSSIIYGQSSTLSWSSTGSSCRLKGGITNKVVGGDGSLRVYPGYTTTYYLYCSNSSGNSKTLAVKILVKSSSTSTRSTVPDSKPPTKPTGFTAAMNIENQVVSLSWQASKDNVGVFAYKLERSENKKQWDIIDPEITDTSFQDAAVSFEVHYYYRVAAVDGAGNASGYAVTDVTTSAFQANVHPDEDTTITSEDGVASVLIPSQSLNSDAFCDLNASTDILAPTISNTKLISGPYSLNCRDKDGAQITSFNQTLTLTIQLNKQLLKGVGVVQIYGQAEDGSWQTMNLTSQDNKKLTYSTDLGNYQTIVVMGTKKKGSVVITIFKILLVLAIIVLIIRFILKLLAKRRAEGQYEEYLQKSKGL